jgi:hypothetical protein
VVVYQNLGMDYFLARDDEQCHSSNEFDERHDIHCKYRSICERPVTEAKSDDVAGCEPYKRQNSFER